jgi:hypothetical protein
MLKFKSLLVLSVLVSQSALAAESKPTVFEKDGQHYSYTTELSHGLVRIRGHVLGSDEQFSLAVSRSGFVAGDFAGIPVSYSVSREEGDRLFKELGDTNVASLEDKAR